jgi:hypothetical protein
MRPTIMNTTFSHIFDRPVLFVAVIELKLLAVSSYFRGLHTVTWQSI